jgi:pyridoxal phosphate enzyme (YggS family)
LIQGVDSAKLLSVINKEAQKCNRKIACLIQVHIAEEETKFGFDAHELDLIKPENFPHVSIVGLMGMASFTSDTSQVEKEFQYLNLLYQKLQPTFPDFQYLSMGMSGDYALAVKNGSNMVRIGSALFGQRVSPKN